jgi:hypothetical protein
MPLKPEQLPLMTLGELMQAMSGREGDRVLMAKAEMLRRQTQAQLDACAAQQRACASLERNASSCFIAQSPRRFRPSQSQWQWALRSTRSSAH